MMSTIEEINLTRRAESATLKAGHGHQASQSSRLRRLAAARQVLVHPDAQVSPLAAELELSPAQCHVLHLIEPDQPMPMRQLADGCAATRRTSPASSIGSNRGAWCVGGVGRGSARQGARADADRRAPAHRVHGAHGRPTRRARAPQRPRAADAGADPRTPARVVPARRARPLPRVATAARRSRRRRPSMFARRRSTIPTPAAPSRRRSSTT